MANYTNCHIISHPTKIFQDLLQTAISGPSGKWHSWPFHLLCSHTCYIIIIIIIIIICIVANYKAWHLDYPPFVYHSELLSWKSLIALQKLKRHVHVQHGHLNSVLCSLSMKKNMSNRYKNQNEILLDEYAITILIHREAAEIFCYKTVKTYTT